LTNLNKIAILNIKIEKEDLPYLSFDVMNMHWGVSSEKFVV